MEQKQITDALRLATIIGRSMDGQSLTMEEQALLNEWEHAAGENRELKQQLTDSDFQLREVQQMQAYDLQSGWKTMSARLKGDRIRPMQMIYRIAAAAAVLLLGLTLGGRLLYNKLTPKAQQPRQYALKDDLPPATSRAFIQLAGGKKVLLDNNKDSSFYSGTILLQKKSGQLSLLQQGSATDNITNLLLVTPPGGTYSIVLPDGTKAWLNAASSLKFPDQFTSNKRTVQLSGEAYFEVAHNSASPFIVIANGTEVQALGTDFNVRAYVGDHKLQAALISGVVQVVSGIHKNLLQPGKMATVTANGTSINPANLTQVMAWKNDLFLFKDIPIEEALQEMARWYDVQIKYTSGFEKQSKFTARISRKVPISQLLSLMEQTGIANFKLENRTLTVIPYDSNQ